MSCFTSSSICHYKKTCGLETQSDVLYQCKVVQSILCTISVPVATSGRMYKTSDNKSDNVMKSYEVLLNTM